MRVIIAGSRNITDMQTVEAAIVASGFQITEVVCGMAPGVDSLGLNWARQRGIPVLERPAAWNDLEVPRARVRTNRFGKPYNANAGSDRNAQMARDAAEVGGGLIAVWDGQSAGTGNMIALAKTYGVETYIHYV
jgi:hypothetical protein